MNKKIDIPKEAVNMNVAAEIPAPQKMSVMQVIAAVAGLLRNDDINSRQAKQIRQQYGVTQTYFTGKHKSEKLKKLARRRAARARTVNHRNNSVKGQTKSGRA
ncbi:MAG: hypothetical protein ACREAU_01645 [Nitrosopumilaceae archaeon]